MRMAVGQLLNYGRFVEPQVRTVLVPERPRPDLLRYQNSMSIDAVYPENDGWQRDR